MPHISAPTFSLFKLSNGIWYVLYSVHGRRRWKSTGCTQKYAAIQILRSMDLAEADLPERDQKPRDFQSFLKVFLPFAKSSYRQKTYDLYVRVAGHVQNPLGACPLSNVPAKFWDDLSVYRIKRVSATTVNIEQRALRAMFNKAVEWQFVERSPFSRSKLVRTVQMPPKYFPKDELNKLLHLVKEDWLRNTIRFSICTGLRRGELIHLRWIDVDLDRRTLTIQSSPNFRVKGDKTRLVPLSSTALAIIQQQAKHPDCPYVFALHGRQIDGNWLSRIFRNYVKKAGLYEKKLHWHNLRSSFAL